VTGTGATDGSAAEGNRGDVGDGRELHPTTELTNARVRAAMTTRLLARDMVEVCRIAA
jgi:hypothetical protein